jgi:ClpP class serine protease
MAAWNKLLEEFNSEQEGHRPAWLQKRFVGALADIAKRRGNRNVLFYCSGFLQKPQLAAQLTQLTPEELNGFMSCMFGMKWADGLTLLLHTPGGATNAAETIVQYLHSKFDKIEVIVPAFAMSAGTMISLASDRIIMGRQSQLGPIDPQMPIGGKYVSARAIVEQFEKAKQEIAHNLALAHAWAPILQSLGPALLVEAQNALDYGERMVAGWLSERMLKTHADSVNMGRKVAKYFNDASSHKSHGRRIARDEARAQGVIVESLEDEQGLQDSVLTAYHLATIMFEQTPATKLLWSNHGQVWLKNAP